MYARICTRRYSLHSTGRGTTTNNHLCCNRWYRVLSHETATQVDPKPHFQKQSSDWQKFPNGDDAVWRIPFTLFAMDSRHRDATMTLFYQDAIVRIEIVNVGSAPRRHVNSCFGATPCCTKSRSCLAAKVSSTIRYAMKRRPRRFRICEFPQEAITCT